MTRPPQIVAGGELAPDSPPVEMAPPGGVTPYDDYAVTFTVRGGRRMNERARRQEPKEIFIVVLDALAAMGMELGGDQRVNVRRLTDD